MSGQEEAKLLTAIVSQKEYGPCNSLYVDG